MKPARRHPVQKDESAQLSAMFAEAGWAPADQHFRERPFVIWHGSFYSVSGTPPNGSPCSKSCQTAEEVLAFLTAYKSKEVPPKPADIIEAARNARPDLFSNTDSPQTVSDPMGEALERQREANARWVQGDGPEEAPQWVPEPEAPAAFADDDIPESIAALMAADRTLTLTEAFRRRINTLNNARLNLTIKPEQTAELDALLERFTELAQRGDRS